MSSPDTNIEKQKHRHRTMVRGIWLGLAVAGVVLLATTVFGANPLDAI